MNAQQLAQQAKLSTAPYGRALSDELILQLELAHVAQWLANQDDSIRAKAADTACTAIESLHADHERTRA